MNKAVVICVGKLKTPFWKAAAAHYQSQIKPWRNLIIKEVRDSAREPALRPNDEANKILELIQPENYNIALAETGKRLTSSELSALLRNCDEKLVKKPVFIIGGPYGLHENVVARCDLCLSLSPMTLPHEFARVMLLEQLYRAESILHHSPYHH